MNKRMARASQSGGVSTGEEWKTQTRKKPKTRTEEFRTKRNWSFKKQVPSYEYSDLAAARAQQA